MPGTELYSQDVSLTPDDQIMQVIDLDAARADARMWLGKSYEAGGEHVHARIEYERFLRDCPDHENADAIRTALSALTGSY